MIKASFDSVPTTKISFFATYCNEATKNGLIEVIKTDDFVKNDY